MLYSMTGFGSAEIESDRYRIKAEIKTLNSKYFDLSLKLPRELSERELEIKTLAGQYLKRGKVNLSLELQPISIEEPTVIINDNLFKSYFDKFREMADEVNADSKDLFRLALNAPDVVTTDEKSIDIQWSIIQDLLKQVFDKCNEFRKEEGGALMIQLKECIKSIQNGLKKVADQDPVRLQQIKSRITANIEDLKEKVQLDNNRFEQELVYYTEKLDISEEKVRLGKHLEYFLEVMQEDGNQGKKLGFISQEIGREINTIGAKANDAVIQREVVLMKDELEKIKEQLLNIL